MRNALLYASAGLAVVALLIAIACAAWIWKSESRFRIDDRRHDDRFKIEDNRLDANDSQIRDLQFRHDRTEDRLDAIDHRVGIPLAGERPFPPQPKQK